MNILMGFEYTSLVLFAVNAVMYWTSHWRKPRSMSKRMIGWAYVLFVLKQVMDLAVIDESILRMFHNIAIMECLIGICLIVSTSAEVLEHGQYKAIQQRCETIKNEHKPLATS
jgi:hypothetical protein